MSSRRLAFNNVLNLRDLGGYPTSEGKTTKFNCFLRSDDLSRITKEEIQYLKDYGLTAVIDLRGNNEIKKLPSPLETINGIKYTNLPLISEEMASGQSAFSSFSLADLYLEIIKNQKLVKQLIELIANNNGTVLFNCSAGKDRTGVTAMLLLGIAGVARVDILADYQITYTYLKKRVEELLEQFPDMPQHVMESRVEWMEQTLDYIDQNFGSINDYLLSCEIEKETIELIKKRFVD